jgi:hypothetical protein
MPGLVKHCIEPYWNLRQGENQLSNSYILVGAEPSTPVGREDLERVTCTSTRIQNIWRWEVWLVDISIPSLFKMLASCSS